jgi:hypothetical protein
VKLELCYDLGDEEKQHHIRTQQLAEIDFGRVQEKTVANQHNSSGYEPTDPFDTLRVIETGLKTGVSLYFKVGGDHQNYKYSGGR